MRVFLCFLLLLVGGKVCCQDSASAKDSVLSWIQGLPSEEEKLERLDSICIDYRRSLDPNGLVYYQERQKLLRNAENFLEGAERTNQTTFYLTLIGESVLSKEEVDRYYLSLSEIENPELQATVAYTKSFSAEMAQENESALESIIKCIDIHEELKDTMTIQFGESYRAQARILQSMGRFGESSIAYSKAKDIFIASEDSIGITDALMGLGILYAQIGLFDDSQAFIEERYRYSPRATESMYMHDELNIGRNLILQGRYAEAILKFQSAVERSNQFNESPHMKVYAVNGLIESLYFGGRSDEIPLEFVAMDSVFNAMGRSSGLQFLYDQSSFFNALVNEEFDQAEDLALSLYEGSKKKGDASELMLHTQFLSELYLQNGDFEKALIYNQEYADSRDSMLTANKTNALLLFQTQYETKEKEAEIQQLGVEKEIERAKSRMYLMLAAGLGIILLLISYLFIQLRKTRKQLELQNTELKKLNATKTKFFGIIGHDLRSPLVTMHAIGNRIRRQMNKGEIDRIPESIDMLAGSVEQTSGLLDNLLKWALSENGVMPYHPELMNVKEFIEKNVVLFREGANQKGIKLSSDIPDELELLADTDAMDGVIRNLISNGIKFTPNGGHVSISAHQNGDGLILEFSDTGVGIAPEKLKHLFGDEMVSERGTNGEVGTGLGLKLVKELVELNKGRLEVESEVGKGTVFKARF